MKTIQLAGSILAATLLSIYLYMALKGPQGLPALHAKWNEIREMQLRNAELAKEVRMREQRISRISKESEVLIRERLKLQRQGETTFILPGDSDPQGVSSEESAAVVPAPAPDPPRPHPPAVRADPPAAPVTDHDLAEGAFREVKTSEEATAPAAAPPAGKKPATKAKKPAPDSDAPAEPPQEQPEQQPEPDATTANQ